MGACAILPRIIGQGRASELLYTGRAMTAQEGEAWGFFNRIVSAQMLQSQAFELASDIARGPILAHAMTKKMRSPMTQERRSLPSSAQLAARQRCPIVLRRGSARLRHEFKAREAP
jgi:enoyl-CoA hydratase/carnithine racemase